MAEGNATRAELHLEVEQLSNRLNTLGQRYEDVIRNNQQLIDENETLRSKLLHSELAENGAKAKLTRAQSFAIADRAQVDQLISTDPRVQVYYMVTHAGLMHTDGRLFIADGERSRIFVHGDGSTEVYKDVPPPIIRRESMLSES